MTSGSFFVPYLKGETEMIEIKDLEGKSVLGRLKHPGDTGIDGDGWLLKVLDLATLGSLVHHCGVLSKKVKPSTNWHSPTYECRKCGARFWTWSDTG